MRLECGSIKGLEDVGRGLERDMVGVYISPKKYRRCGEGRVAVDF